MTGPKRSKAEREHDLVVTAKLYLQGKNHWEIQDAINESHEYHLSRNQITYDIKDLHNRWRESALVSFDEAMAMELAKIDVLEQEYWQAWQRSVGTHREVTKSTEQSGGDKEPWKKSKAVIREKELAGDPRFLEGVRWCIQKRMDIFGLEAPKKLLVGWKEAALKSGADPEILESVYDETVNKFVAVIEGGSKRDDA